LDSCSCQRRNAYAFSKAFQPVPTLVGENPSGFVRNPSLTLGNLPKGCLWQEFHREGTPKGMPLARGSQRKFMTPYIINLKSPEGIPLAVNPCSEILPCVSLLFFPILCVIAFHWLLRRGSQRRHSQRDAFGKRFAEEKFKASHHKSKISQRDALGS
jgi:hypothetical protein